jgi:hypothetical protein
LAEAVEPINQVDPRSHQALVDLVVEVQSFMDQALELLGRGSLVELTQMAILAVRVVVEAQDPLAETLVTMVAKEETEELEFQAI